MDKVVKYVRVPVKNQKKILEEQQRELMQYAEQKGFEVAEVGMLCKKTEVVEQIQGIFADEGTNTRDIASNRKAFNEMILEALESNFNQIVIKDIETFNNSICNQTEIVRILRNHGINIHFCKGEIDTINLSNDETLEELFRRVEEKEINGKKIEQNQ